MDIHNLSTFQKEIQEIGFKNPKIKFNSGLIKIVTLPFFDDIIFQLVLWTLSLTFLFNNSLLFPSIIFFGLSCYYFYMNFIGWDICQIDFNTKNIYFKNRIFILNLSRKIFGIRSKLAFSDINTLGYKQGTLIKSGLYLNDNRFYIVLNSKYDPSIIISQFKSEKDAENLASILRKFILPKEKIIV